MSLRRVFGYAATEGEQVSSRLMQSEEASLLRAAVARLKQRDRRVIFLRHHQGHGNAQIAALLGVSQKTASIRYARALSRLRNQLQSLPDREID